MTDPVSDASIQLAALSIIPAAAHCDNARIPERWKFLSESVLERLNLAHLNRGKALNGGSV
jgi:hypothetical protein